MTQKFNWESRPTKAVVRHEIFARLPKKAKCYLGLPGLDTVSGKTGMCIRKGIDSGIITKKTKVIGYEYSLSVAKKIRAGVKHDYPGYDITIFDGDIADAKIDPNSTDFAFLDFLGMLNHKKAVWIQDTLLPGMRLGSSIAITAPYGRQEGNFYKSVLKRLNSDLSVYKKAIQDQYKLWDMPSCKEGDEDRRARAMTVQLFTMKYLMRGYWNSTVYRRFYHDKQNMLAMLFTGIRPLRKKEPKPIPDLGLV